MGTSNQRAVANRKLRLERTSNRLCVSGDWWGSASLTAVEVDELIVALTEMRPPTRTEIRVVSDWTAWPIPIEIRGRLASLLPDGVRLVVEEREVPE